jgi:hypothetical protein
MLQRTGSVGHDQAGGAPFHQGRGEDDFGKAFPREAELLHCHAHQLLADGELIDPLGGQLRKSWDVLNYKLQIG